MKIKTGIFGGTFNPIHIGHLALANYICEFEELDELWFLVTPQNPLRKGSDFLDDNKRLELVKLATEGYSKFVASDFELHLPKPSYTWLLAARPKTLTGAVVPILIGTGLAIADGKFNWLPALICCLFAFLMQVASNLINDLFDFLKGTDREDRLGPERACAQGWISPSAMKIGIIIVVSLACKSTSKKFYF